VCPFMLNRVALHKKESLNTSMKEKEISLIEQYRGSDEINICFAFCCAFCEESLVIGLQLGLLLPDLPSLSVSL